jgi:hypothetical protein
MLQLVEGDAWDAPGLHAVMCASLQEDWGCIFFTKKYYNLLLCFFVKEYFYYCLFVFH